MSDLGDKWTVRSPLPMILSKRIVGLALAASILVLSSCSTESAALSPDDASLVRSGATYLGTYCVKNVVDDYEPTELDRTRASTVVRTTIQVARANPDAVLEATGDGESETLTMPDLLDSYARLTACDQDLTDRINSARADLVNAAD